MFDLHLGEIWRYRDLLYLFVRRDFVNFYKQTILGPLWFVLQPVLTTLMFTLVFGQIAGLSTDGAPPFLFYLAGVTCWTYFAECLRKTSTTFVDNTQLFGKVYFPRVITPLAIIASNLIQFAVQLVLFLSVAGWYAFHGKITLQPSLALLPLLVLLMACSALGLGLIFSAVTTKYRDLRFLLQFGIQLMMYATPVIYPLSMVPPKYASMMRWNPLTPVLETFRHGFIGVGELSAAGLTWSSVFALTILILGVAVFNGVEKTFMDTV